VKTIRAHNKQKRGWHMHVNKFSDMTREEFKEHTRGFHHAHAVRMRGSKSDSVPSIDTATLAQLPKEVDWSKKMSAVKEQGGCGSCWAFAATEVLEAHLMISENLSKPVTLSTQQISSCTPNPNFCGGHGGCQGATCQLAFEYVKSAGGAGTAVELPYKSYFGETGECQDHLLTEKVVTIGGYEDLPANDYVALMKALAEHGPVAISVDASAWQNYHGGIFTDSCGSDINHAVVLVGYGEENGQKYWKVRNSWGERWGEGGYIRLARDFEDQHLNDACAMDNTPLDGYACEKDSPVSAIKVCGKCGILSSSSYPTDVQASGSLLKLIEKKRLKNFDVLPYATS